MPCRHRLKQVSRTDYFSLSAIYRLEAELARDKISHLSINPVRVESVLRKQQALTTVLDELVREPEAHHSHFVQLVFFEQLHDRAAEAAHQIMIFCRDYRAVRTSDSQYQLRVERLHKTSIYHGYVDAFQRQPLGRFNAVADLRSYSEDRHVRAFPKYLGFADLEGLDLFIHRHPDAAASRVTHRRRTVIHDTGLEHVPKLVLVLRRHDHKPGHRSQVSEVHQPMMSRTISSGYARTV